MEGVGKTIPFEFRRIFHKYGVKDADKESFVNAFEKLGVENEDDLHYVKDEDLIVHCNIKVVTARKFMEKLKIQKLTKKRKKSSPEAQTTTTETTLHSPITRTISPDIMEEIKAREAAAREEALLLAEIERREDIRKISQKNPADKEAMNLSKVGKVGSLAASLDSTLVSLKSKEIEERQQILSHFVTFLRDNFMNPDSSKPLIPGRRLTASSCHAYFPIEDTTNSNPNSNNNNNNTNTNNINTNNTNNNISNNNNTNNNNNNNHNNNSLNNNNASAVTTSTVSATANVDQKKEEKGHHGLIKQNAFYKPKEGGTVVSNEHPKKEEEEEGEHMINNCSVMEYETVISNKKSQYDVLLYIQSLNEELYRKVGGAVAPSDTNIVEVSGSARSDGRKDYRLLIKWMLPMEAFGDGSVDPEDLANWLVDSIPPVDANAMGSKKGIFIDVDLNVFKRLLNNAFTRWPSSSK